MPKGTVKTKADERRWRECTASVKKAHPKLSTKSDRFYSMVMGCFQRRKHKLGGRKVSVVRKKKKSW